MTRGAAGGSTADAVPAAATDVPPAAIADTMGTAPADAARVEAMRSATTDASGPATDGAPAGAIVWFTGLPSSGKTTLARRVQARLAGAARPALLLDSDELRDLLGNRSYAPADRDEFYRALAALAVLIARQGWIALVAATAPRREHRDRARSALAGSPRASTATGSRRAPRPVHRTDGDETSASGARGAQSSPRRTDGEDVPASGARDTPAQRTADGAASGLGAEVFLEVWVDTPVAECEARDPKGLYAQARRGDASQLPGVGVAYEPPLAPEVVAHGGVDETAVTELVRRLAQRP